MSCLKYIVIFLIMFECVLCRKIKTKIPCFKNNVTGICRRINECPYAVTIVNQEQRKPPTCGYDYDGAKIVCCPSQNLMHTTGTFQKYFKATHDGVIASVNVTCRYEGKQPFLCCKNQPNVPEPPEPEGCRSQAPPLPAPTLKLNPMEQFLWDKCVSYQKYVYKCVNDEDNPEKFTRQNTCGIPPTKDRFRMIGADPAFDRQFPHMAVVGCQDPKKDVDIIWVGGGSLISENFILTAAHVLWSPDYGRIYYALLGTLNKKSHDSLLVNVINTIPHKLYEMNSESKMYDIALLRLHERVKFNEFIRPICLPVSNRKITEDWNVAGWGQINSKGDTSDELRYVDIREQNYNSSCKRFFGDVFDPKTMICAHGNESEVMDSCKGDSGGPLMAQITNIICSYSIEGIVSFGTNTCGGNVGVYTRVTAYLDWIVKRVWPDEWEKFNENI